MTTSGFIIAGYGRTGTTAIAATLASHPDIDFREPLSRFHEPFFRGATPPYLVGASDLNFAFGERMGNGREGLKVLWNHVTDDPGVAEVVLGTRGLPVIHVVRHNLLRQYVSLHSPGRWIRLQGMPATAQRLCLDVRHVSSWVMQHRSPPDDCQKWLASCRVVEVVYEEFRAKGTAALAPALRFLACDPTSPMTTPTRVQHPEPLESYITNLREVLAALGELPFDANPDYY